MTSTPNTKPVASPGTSAAKHHVPEGRLSPDQSAAPEFEAVVEEPEVVDVGETGSPDEAEGGGDAARFEAIKAECRYCGRSLDMDPSL